MTAGEFVQTCKMMKMWCSNFCAKFCFEGLPLASKVFSSWGPSILVWTAMLVAEIQTKIEGSRNFARWTTVFTCSAQPCTEAGYNSYVSYAPWCINIPCILNNIYYWDYIPCPSFFWLSDRHMYCWQVFNSSPTGVKTDSLGHQSLYALGSHEYTTRNHKKNVV